MLSGGEDVRGGHFFRQRLRHSPHADVAAAGDRLVKAHHFVQIPPEAIPFVPEGGGILLRVVRQPQVVPSASRIAAGADNSPGPVLDLAPGEKKRPSFAPWKSHSSLTRFAPSTSILSFFESG